MTWTAAMIEPSQRGFPAGMERKHLPLSHLHVAHIPAASLHFLSLSFAHMQNVSTKPGGTAAAEMSVHHGTLLCLGVLLMTSGGIMVFSSGTLHHATVPLMVLGIFLGMGGLSLVVAGVCMAKKNFQVGVPGHFLLHPPTGTRFSPQQALAIQRRLDRIRREMSTDAVSTSPEPEPSLPSTPPPWTMEPPPSYDTVMKSQEHAEQLNQEPGQETNQKPGEQLNHERNGQQHLERTEYLNQECSQQV